MNLYSQDNPATIAPVNQKERNRLNYLKRKARLGLEFFRQQNKASYLKNRETACARNREYYTNNTAKVSARAVAYRKRRPEVLRKAMANYRHRHPDRIKAYQKAYCAKHGNIHQKNWARRNRKKITLLRQSQAEKWRKYDRAWRDKNRARINSRRVQLWKSNPAKYRTKAVVCSAKRRALKKQSEVNPTSVKQFIVEMRGKSTVACFWCKDKIAGKDCHIDHIIALSRGGKHAVENLCVSCEPCNLSKGPKSLQDWNLVKPDPQLVLI